MRQLAKIFDSAIRDRDNADEAFDLTAPDVSQQIIDLQMTVAHLEHDLSQMHDVLLAVQADLKAMRDQMAKLERRVVLSGEPAEQRDPNDERPPHY